MQQVGFLDYFNELEDPRSDINKLYPIGEILFLTLCAVVCGAEGWQDVEDYGKSKLLFLRNYLPYGEGIPSDDTLRRFFRAIDNASFQQMFIDWAKSLNLQIDTGVIAIDGKTSRRSHDGDKKALHTVSAFASEARIVLGQQRTDEKSNEITAIPKLLELLDIKGSVVSIDAMGCQKEIARKINKKGGDYLLALKGNQTSLHEDIKLFFEDAVLTEDLERYKEIDGGHGRIETRRCTVTDDIDWLKERHNWVGLKSIIRVDASVEKNKNISEETRYYISSLAADPAKILSSIRSHWAIENSLHWVLDMSFNEDQSRIRKENAPENMAIIRHIALNMIRRTQKKRQSVKGLRKQAGWDNDILHHILLG